MDGRVLNVDFARVLGRGGAASWSSKSGSGAAIPEKSRSVSAVSKPKSALGGEVRRLAAPVIDLRKRQAPERLESVGLSLFGLVLMSSRPMQESCVARLAIQTATTPIEGWFNVVLCVVEGARFRIELQAFAPSVELRELMNQLWSKADKLPA